MSQIKITCKADTFLPFQKIQDFQGALKTRTKEDVDHLVYSIQTHGFSFPFFVWRRPDGGCSCLDGHGRIMALQQLEKEGCEIPELPVVYIDAKDEAEARKKLIQINITTGTFTSAGFCDLVKDIPDLDLSQYHYPELDLDKIGRELDMLSTAEDAITNVSGVNWSEVFGDVPSVEEASKTVNDAVPPRQQVEADADLEIYLEPDLDDVNTDAETGIKELVVNCPQCGESFVYRFR